MLTEVVQYMTKLKVKARKQVQYTVCITVQDCDGGNPFHTWNRVLHGTSPVVLR